MPSNCTPIAFAGMVTVRILALRLVGAGGLGPVRQLAMQHPRLADVSWRDEFWASDDSVPLKTVANC